MGEEAVTTTLVLGYAMDGFPIYGPLADDEVSALDACNGITNADGSYQYHVRAVSQVDEDLDYCVASGSPQNNWNYILGCYSGSVAASYVYDSTTYALASDCVSDGTAPTSAPTDTSSAQGIVLPFTMMTQILLFVSVVPILSRVL